MRFTRRLPGVIACLTAIGMTLGFALEPPVRIMPLGDSLTYGETLTTVQGGYRNRLHSLLTSAGYHVDFVGTFSDTDNPTLPDVNHQGDPGKRIDQIQASLAGWLNSVESPDAVLLLVGTNDIWQNYQLSGIQTRLTNLIADIATRRPFAKIIVSSLPQRTDNATLEARQVDFNSSIPGIVAQQVALGRQVSYVDMHAVLTPLDYSSDGVHPSTGGYEKMANTWSPALANVISPQGTANPPLIAQIGPLVDLTHVSVVFSKPVADDAVGLANFSISSGSTVTNAVLDTTTKRTITLTTSPQTPGVVYSLSVSGVKDRTARQTQIAAGSMANFSPGPVTNGSFEEDFAGWVPTGNLEIQDSSPYVASDGAKLVSFNSGQTTPNGTLSQSFTTTPGQNYQLTFDLGIYSTNNSTQQMQVTVQGATALVSDTLSIQRQSGIPMRWIPKSYLFTANSTTTNVLFTDVSTITNNVDLLLDKVRVTALDMFTLAVTSSPLANADITLSQTDIYSNGNGTTGLIRTYNPGTSVTVTAPAAYLGKNFLTWRKYGVSVPGSGPSISLIMEASHALDAVYGSAPTATAQSVTLSENSTRAITLQGMDSDGDSLAFAIVTPPAHGVLTGTPPNLTYTPGTGYHGPDNFTFKANDGAVDSSPATVTITVNPFENYNQWLDGYGLTSASDADPDQDSIGNAVEYVIGGNPASQPDTGLLPTATLVTADPDGDLTTADYLLFTYRRTLLAHTDPSVAMAVEYNTGLDGPWTDAEGAQGVVTTIDNFLGPEIDLVKVHLPYSLAPNGILFARLRIVITTP